MVLFSDRQAHTKGCLFMKKMFKKSIAAVMAVASLAVSMTGISASAASYNGARCDSKVSGGLTYYRGVGYADGSTYKVVSGYINTSGGKVYASGGSTYMTTPWVASPATSGTGQFTMSYNNTVTLVLTY